MRLISIEKNTGTSVVINTTNLCSIYEDAGTVLIRMACGHAIATKFTDVEHAVDYIKRAEYIAQVKSH